jgi:hypothetical protein
MTEHDGTVACAKRIKFQLRDVMQHEDTLTPCTNYRCIRQFPRPGMNINVAAHRMSGGELPQALEHVPASNVTRVDDEIRASECHNRLRPQQPMRIRNDTDVHFKRPALKRESVYDHRFGTLVQP